MNIHAEQTASIVKVGFEQRTLRRRTTAALVPFTITGYGRAIPREVAMESLDVVETVLRDLEEGGKANEIRVGNIEIGTGGWEVLGIIGLGVG